MSEIHILNQDTINKIAAGEVIERPMAVVKELIENAIDANASAVTVEVRDGGKALIRMTDNGIGMTQEDVRLAFTPHATSKIDTAEDLMHIATLGFRGEALASISSVSQLEMVTKVRSALMGCRYQADGGQETAMEAVGCPDGTTILVRNLFYNTPARLKFLKSSPTEAGYISTLLERMALSHPEISFRFINQNQPKLHTSGNGNLKDVIYHVYGKEIASNLVEIDAQEVSCRVTGFLGKPVISRGNRGFMNYFINGRYIRSATVHKAIEDAYQPYTMQHRYPFTVLHFTVDPEMVDINVHPQKMEIRFSDAQGVYQSVYHAVSEALKHREFIPEMTLAQGDAPHADAKKKTGTHVQKQVREPEIFEKKRGQSLEILEEFRRQEQARAPQEMMREQPPVYGQTDKTNTDAAEERMATGNPMEGQDAKDIPAGSTEAGQNAEKPGTKPGVENAPGVNPATGNPMEGQDAKDIPAGSTAAGQNAEKPGTKPGVENAPGVNPAMGNPMAGQDAKDIPAGSTEAGQNVEKPGTKPGVENASGVNPVAGNIGSDRVQVDVPQNAALETAGRILPGRKGAVQESLFDGESGILSGQAQREIKIIGQVFDTYWILQYDTSMYLVDQHAAHEKVLYERFMKQIRAHQPMVQQLQPPVILTLSMQEEQAVREHQDVFEGLGYQIEPFGGREYAVTGVPAHLPQIGEGELLREVIDTLVDDGHAHATPESLRDRIATMSCKAAVKGKNQLPREQMEELLRELMTLENPYHCPHGRPTMIRMTRTELDKKFKRIV